MKKRARDLGIPFEGICGVNNAITDVDGVEVGYTTLIRGESAKDTAPADDFARTGVTQFFREEKAGAQCSREDTISMATASLRELTG